MSFSCFRPLWLFLIRTYLLGKIVYICSIFLTTSHSSITATQIELQPLHRNYPSVLSGDTLIAKLNSNASFLSFLTFLCHLAQATISFLKLCHPFALLLSITFSNFPRFWMVIRKFSLGSFSSSLYFLKSAVEYWALGFPWLLDLILI